MKSKILIVFLILIILGLGGYIAYDKVINKETEEPAKEEKNEVKDNTISNEEALAMGKEKYEFAREGLYLCGWKQVKYDTNKHYSYSDTGMKEVSDGTGAEYAKITNIEDIKSNLTKHAFIDWIKSLDIKNFEKDYYINVGGCGISPDYAYDKYNISVKQINEDSIVYSIDEYFYGTDDNGISEDLSKATKYTSNFELIKEDNTWKINEFNDAEIGYRIYN